MALASVLHVYPTRTVNRTRHGDLLLLLTSNSSFCRVQLIHQSIFPQLTPSHPTEDNSLEALISPRKHLTGTSQHPNAISKKNYCVPVKSSNMPATFEARVKSVLSGDTLILTHVSNRSSERTLSLAYISAPRLRREGDEVSVYPPFQLHNISH